MIIMLDGHGVVCQIDKSMFHYKQKYHNDSISRHNKWVCGIVDTSTSPSKYYIQVVPDRRAVTLLPIIRSVCRLGATSRGYQALNSDFTHQTVNNGQNFIIPSTEAYT